MTQVKEPEAGKVCCWRFGEMGHLEKAAQGTAGTNIGNTLKS